MQTIAPTWRALVLPIMFTLVCVVVAFALWRLFGGGVPLEPKGYRFTTVVPQAHAIFPNTDVRIAGVSVGKVSAVRQVGRIAEATIDVDPGFAPVRAGARTIARTKTLLGEAYIEIAPGAPTAKAIPDGGRLPAANSQQAQRLDDVLDTFRPQTRAEIRQLFAGLKTAFAERSADVNTTLGHARPFAADLSEVLGIAERQDDDVRTLISSSATIFETLGRRQSALTTAITEGDRVLAATASRDRALESTIREMPPFLSELGRASDALADASGDLRSAVDSLRPTTPLLVPALASLDRNAPSFRAIFRELSPTISSGMKGLPALSRVLRAAQPAMKPTYDASREFIPVVELAAVTRNEIVGALSNMANMTNGRIIAPGGVVKGYVNGFLTAWNEIIGGWTKKLPTNRSNPYMEPGGLRNIATGGLKAFDCRNTGNPLVVPPTGTGAPPCITQQPWSFKGKTAAYPRLELAAP